MLTHEWKIFFNELFSPFVRKMKNTTLPRCQHGVCVFLARKLIANKGAHTDEQFAK